MEEDEINVKGDKLALRIFKPSDNRLNGAAVVLAHGLSCTMDSRLFAFAEKFAEAGLTAITFDYRNFGFSGGRLRQYINVPMQMEDWHNVLAYARNRADVDADRIVIWSTSFGGGLATHVAHDDGNIRAVVAQCPMMDNPKTIKLGMSQRSSAQNNKLKRLAVRAALMNLVGLRGPCLPVTDPSRMSIIPSDESVKFHEVGGPTWRNEVAVLSFAKGQTLVNNPIRIADGFTTPLMLQICEKDETVDNAGAEAFAEKAGTCVTKKYYDCGHFDLYLEPLFPMAAADATAYFLSHL
jgi:alpha-beta hydrolase superfamily lysophospholipase